MKLKIILAGIAIGFTNFVSADQTPVINGHKEILSDVKAEVKKCVVMSISQNSDQNIVRSFESTCQTIKLISDMQAQVYLENEWFTASIIESSDADGGDLDNMELRDSNGKLVATRSNVPAFDSIVFAMTGGDQKLRLKTIN